MYLFAILFLILINICMKKSKYKINLYPVIVIILILYSGLRYNYSFDYENYLIHFNEINSLSSVISTGFEKGYSLLIFVFKILGFGFNTFLLFIAFLSIKMKEKVFNRLSVFPEISLLIYFLLFYVSNDVEQIRHGISISFCFYSLIFLYKSDKKSNIISFSLIILGVLFHTSAMLFIPVYFIKDKVFSKKKYFIYFVISILLSFINFYDFIVIFNDIFLHSQYITQKISIYASNKHSFVSLTLLIKCVTLCIFGIYVFDYKNKLHRLLFNTYYIGILYTILLSSIPILVARGTAYMRYSELLMIPMYIQNIKNKENKKIHILIITLLFSYYFFKFFILIINPEYFYYTTI